MTSVSSKRVRKRTENRLRFLYNRPIVKDGKTFNEMPYGWMELDITGMVTKYRPADEKQKASDSSPDIVGCNLFTDVAPISEVKEFRDRFQVFVQAPLPAEVFNLTFNDSRESIHARIMLAQGSEYIESRQEKFVLVSVTKV
jgi:hypothetical protein